MIASATAEDFRRTIEQRGAEPSVDAVIAIFIPPLVTRAPDVAAAIRAADTGGKPLLAVFMAATDAERAALAGDGRVPVYPTPEEAVRALAHAVRYAAWRRAGAGRAARLTGIDADRRVRGAGRRAGRRRRLARPRATSRPCCAPTASRWSSRASRPPAPRRPAARRRARRPRGLEGRRARRSCTRRTPAASRSGCSGASAVTRAARAMAAAVRAAGHEPTGFVVQRDGGGRHRADRRDRRRPGLRPGRGLRRGRARRRAARRRRGAARAARPARRERDAALAAHVPAARRLPRRRDAPTSAPSRTCCCASRRWPPHTRRSPSSTATRCSRARTAPSSWTPASAWRHRRPPALPRAGPVGPTHARANQPRDRSPAAAPHNRRSRTSSAPSTGDEEPTLRRSSRRIAIAGDDACIVFLASWYGAGSRGARRRVREARPRSGRQRPSPARAPPAPGRNTNSSTRRACPTRCCAGPAMHDLVVVGAPAHARATGIVLGKTATLLVHHCAIPVLVARERPLSAGIVAATRARPADRVALTAGAHLAARAGRRAHRRARDGARRRTATARAAGRAGQRARPARPPARLLHAVRRRPRAPSSTRPRATARAWSCSAAAGAVGSRRSPASASAWRTWRRARC